MPELIELRRIPDLPPYAFAEIDALKLELRRAGEDVIDLGFGNPDMPSPAVAVDEARRGGAQAAQPPLLGEPRHPEPAPARSASCTSGGSASRSTPRREAITTIGAKEGLSHLMWVLVGPGDAALVPARATRSTCSRPCSPAPTVAQVRMGADGGRRSANIAEAYERSRPRPRVVDRSRSRTTRRRDRRRLEFMQRARRLRARARDRGRARLRVRGPRLRRLRAAVDPRRPRARGRRRRALHAHEVVLDGGLAHRLPASATPRSSPRSARLKSYLDYGTFQPIQIAATVAMNEAPDFPKEVSEIYRGRRDALCDGLGAHRLADRAAEGDDVRLGADPASRTASSARIEFALLLAAGGEGRGPPGRRASAPAARATSASRWSRTSSASGRPCAASGACSSRR